MSISLDKRLQILEAIGDYITSEDVSWKESIKKAGVQNPWFTEEMVLTASRGIASSYLQPEVLQEVVRRYEITDAVSSQTMGVINAGNIPLVGFHDFLSAFIMGVPAQIKLSSKDEVLFANICAFASESFPEFGDYVQLADKLQNCDAYRATGGETSSLYFKKYFGQKPNIIRSHRTSVAILTGDETAEELQGLSDDIHLYYGLGCRNVTHLYVPEGYDFQNLLESFSRYEYFAEHNKYMNNYDYQLAIYIINGDQYMQRYSTLVVENEALSSPVSVVYYSYYKKQEDLRSTLPLDQIQCVVSHTDTPFGQSQSPGVFDFADGLDTFEFCKRLV